MIRVGSYNVHTFSDASWNDNGERVGQLLRKARVGLAGLSEVEESGGVLGRKVMPLAFPRADAARAGNKAGHCGSEIIFSRRAFRADPSRPVHTMSRLQRRIVIVHGTELVGPESAVGAMAKIPNRPSLATIPAPSRPSRDASDPSSPETASTDTTHSTGDASAGDSVSQAPEGVDFGPLTVACLHLDYRDERRRMEQLESTLEYLKSKVSAARPTLLCGDFNALSDDMDPAHLAEVRGVRARNGWEPPMTDVTARLAAAGWTDVWRACVVAGTARDPDAPSPAVFGTTCRFDTRIDYVFVNDAFLSTHEIVGCEVVRSDASDHSMVVAEFRQRTGGQ
jgi:hypothetical protein